MSQAIEERVRSIISDQLGVAEDEIKSESKFIEDLGADSLDIVELIIAMEEENSRQKFPMKKRKEFGMSTMLSPILRTTSSNCFD